MVHEIFNSMSEEKEIRFCWSIKITIQSHGEVLNTIVCWNIDVHEATNPVIEGTPMQVFNFI